MFLKQNLIKITTKISGALGDRQTDRQTDMKISRGARILYMNKELKS
jgi:hypothetical protein